jgi:thioesterase domain-containing protein
VTHQEVEAYLHEHIPISKDMEVAVAHASPEEVLLRAPLAPNINHRSTVFGGSISTLAILAGWTLVHLKLQLLPFRSRLVIQSNNINYLLPIEDDFAARCLAPAPRDWERFVVALTKRKKARLDIQAQVVFDEQIAATFEARYVASQLGN